MVILEGVDGSQFPLSAVGGTGDVWLNKGAKGLDMLPWDVQVEEYPALHGSYPRAVRGLSREILLPLTIYGETRPAMVAQKRRLVSALNPSLMATRSPKLIVAEADTEGTYEDQREIDVYYAGGLEGDEGTDNGLTWGRYGLVLRSTEPFFRARRDIVKTFSETPAGLKPFFPDDNVFLSDDGESGGFKLTSDPRWVDKVTIVNPGSVGAYPTWTIVGPISGPFNLVREATRYGPQQTLMIKTLSLGAGQSATIVTEPGKVKVTASAGATADWSTLAINPTFWTLDPGPNVVSIQGLPAGVRPSKLQGTFRPRYLGM
ncbi:hypothetical protein [Spirillospora sp. CA-294931]|uniref:hypothetical protein n=1 Tax=Spirillospora sp. CA-294931 TaxID=3240042 RepID=UPI003D9139C2